MSENDSMTPQEVANALRIAKNTVYELVKRGELPVFRVGNRFRFKASDVETYKNGGRQPESPSLLGSFVAPPPELDSQRSQTTSLGGPIEPSGQSGFILCGQDIMLDLLAQRLEAHPKGGRVFRSYLGSYNGLHALYQGKAHAATAHLWDGANDSYNLSYLPHILPGTALVVMHLACRSVGFYVPKGNPKGLRDWSDLARGDLSLINRERGSGMRVLLDERLRRAGIAPTRLPGYATVCTTHLAAAAAVAKGGGDFAIGSEKASRQVNGIDFIPLQRERYELVFQKEDQAKPIFRALAEIIQSPGFRQELDGLGGYDTHETGRVMIA